MSSPMRAWCNLDMHMLVQVVVFLLVCLMSINFFHPYDQGYVFSYQN